jgi:ATP-dependent helicase/nuclease subunit A
MNRSFRSASGVINAVNLLIEDLFDTSQPPYENQDLIHNVAPKNERLPYNVEIWSPNYDILEDKKSNRHRNLAQSIVNKIIDIHNNHNIAYKDILILYAKRENNAILKYIITLLKNNDIPVLGLDKINLIDNIAILDLIALTKFLLQNQDDFSLCCVLKSPLFNLGDEDIIYLKHHDVKQSIFKNLTKICKCCFCAI